MASRLGSLVRGSDARARAVLILNEHSAVLQTGQQPGMVAEHSLGYAPAMTSLRERLVHANGLEHHVLEWNMGGAPTIVCCHGFLDLGWSFVWLAEELAAAGFRVVAFDWRGHGESEHVGRGGYYHFADYI